jgi:hypothetical protein
VELVTARATEAYASGFYARRGLVEVDRAVLRARRT